MQVLHADIKRGRFYQWDVEEGKHTLWRIGKELHGRM